MTLENLLRVLDKYEQPYCNTDNAQFEILKGLPFYYWDEPGSIDTFSSIDTFNHAIGLPEKNGQPMPLSDYYDRPYSIPEIQRLLDKADIRSKVIILLLASTGMRVGAIPGLKLSDIKYIDEFGLYLIWVYNNSRKDRYYTFCTPESANAIKAYLEYRKRSGEQIKDSSHVIRNFISIDNPFTAKVSRPISVRMVQDIIIGLQKEAGLCDNSNNVMLCHGFRKAYITTLDRAGIQFTTREYLSGHHLPKQDASYIRATEEDRLKEYLKAADALTIDPTNRLQKKVQELESEQAEEITMLKEKLKSYDETLATHAEYYENSQKQITDMFKVMDKQGGLIKQMGRQILGLDDFKMLKRIEKNKERIS